MFKLKAIKPDKIGIVIVAYNDAMQEHHFLSIENAKGLSTHISWILNDRGDNFWVNNMYGVSKPENNKNAYAVSFSISNGFFKSYILNKRKLIEFKNSLMGALDG